MPLESMMIKLNKIFIFIILFYTVVFADDPNLRRIADQYEKLGQYNSAVEFYIKLLNQNSNDIAAYMGAKRCLLQSENLDKLEQLIYSLQKEKRDVRYQVDLAEVIYLRGDHKKAIEQWNTLVEDNSRNHNVYSLVGAAYLEHHLYDEAIDLYTSGRKVFRDQTIYVFELAHIYSIKGEYRQVTQEYLKYLAKYPDQISFIESQIYRLATDRQAGEQIIDTLKKLLKDASVNNTAVHQILAGIYTRNKQYDNAFIHYLELEKSEQKDNIRGGAFLYKFAQILLQDEEYDYAAKILELLVRNYPKTPYAVQARMGLAQVLEQQKKYNEAISAYQEVVNDRPRTPEAIQALLKTGDIWYDRLFDLEKAQAVYMKIVDTYPNTATATEAQFRLGECKISAGDLENAEKVFLHLLNHQGKRSKNDRQRALLKLAYVKFFHQRPSRSLGYLNSFLKDDEVKADIYKNDALELALLLRENQMDSLGLATLGKAHFFSFQRKYEQSKQTIEDFMPLCFNDQLKDEFGVFLAELYQELEQPDTALEKWKHLAENENSLYSDLAYFNMAKIYQENKNEPETAQQYYEYILLHYPYSVYIEDVRNRIRTIQSANEE